MRKIIVDIVITADEYIKLYQGLADDVHCKSRDGRTVQFPAHILRPYLEHEGIDGSFDIYFDDENKYHSIIKTA